MSEAGVSQEIFRIAERFSTDKIEKIDRITDGAINETFEVSTATGYFILQRMNVIFSPVVMKNLALVQDRLQENDVVVPTGIDTVDGEEYITDGAHWYRALSYVPGKTIHDNLSHKGAESAGALAGAFHSALVDFPTSLEVAIQHFHDNDFYVRELQRAMSTVTNEQKQETLLPLAERALAHFGDYADKVPNQPKRVVHADLKVSNIRFDENENAIALIDMDTMMEDTIAVEMGDALRSWGGVMGEDSRTQIFNEEIAVAALRGYKNTAINVTAEEIASIPAGIAAMTASLAIRFVTDAFNESYFVLSSKYPSLYEQNMTRAENQLRLLADYETKIDILKEVVKEDG